MEREVEQEQMPVAVELVSTQDRTCVMIVVRASEKIPVAVLMQTLEAFSGELRKKFTKSAIDVQTPKIIIP